MAEKAKTKTKTKRKGKRKGGVDQRLVKALAHPLRVQILIIFNERMASPNELAKELEEGLSQVSYHVKVLKDYECIALVKTEPRRGAVEHYYRATSRAFLTDRDWQQLPDSIRPGMSAGLMQTIVDDAAGALEEGTFDARDNRHLSRTSMILDEQGWGDLTEALTETLGRVVEIQNESAGRLAKTGEEGHTVAVAMMGFEVPGEERKKAAKKASKKGKASKRVKARKKGKASKKA